ncbi:MAG TPA: hypothetical protein VFP65_25740 [Anaeromyxobacteraceae bacterium]|nr:hypothetical protein [Anaeromyxobacteraceae bacterium]
MKKVGWVVGLVALGFSVSASAQTDTQQRAQDQAQPQSPPQAQSPTASTQSGGAARCADPCAACMAKIQGTGSSAEAASCPNACSACDRLRASGGQAQAGQSSAQAQPGPDVTASLDNVGQSVSNSVNSAAAEVKQNFGQASDRGLQGIGPRENTLVTDAIGTFTGEGVNVEYQRPLAEKISGVVGAHYSHTDAVGGAATVFGFTLGGDYFLVGSRNQGLRIGPRAGLDFGGVSANDDTNFDAQIGLAGELGYNWMGRSGVTLELATGLGGRVGGSVGGLNDRFGGDWGPYLRANLGWSW